MIVSVFRKIKTFLKPNAKGELVPVKLPLPEAKSREAAGYDIFTPVDIVIEPGEMVVVETGLIVKSPRGFYTKIVPRSGLAFKHGITIVNTPGTVDRDYCGPDDTIKVMLYRLPGKEGKGVGSDVEGREKPLVIPAGSSFAQMILTPYTPYDWQEEAEADFARSDNRGGLGSTDAVAVKPYSSKG